MRRVVRTTSASRPFVALSSPATYRRSRRVFHTKSSDCSEALGTAAKLPDAEPLPPITPRETISVQDILDRRKKAGKLVAMTAAASDSDMFKAPVGLTTLPPSPPLDLYDCFADLLTAVDSHSGSQWRSGGTVRASFSPSHVFRHSRYGIR